MARSVPGGRGARNPWVPAPYARIDLRGALAALRDANCRTEGKGVPALARVPAEGVCDLSDGMLR